MFFINARDKNYKIQNKTLSDRMKKVKNGPTIFPLYKVKVQVN